MDGKARSRADLAMVLMSDPKDVALLRERYRQRLTKDAVRKTENRHAVEDIQLARELGIKLEDLGL